MRTSRVLLTTLALLIAAAVNAQSVKLTSSQISELLTGNTAVGKWQGQHYRQFFDEEGQTIYAQRDAGSSVGKWRIDTTIDEYQSLWPNEQDWEGWYVMEYAGDYYWVSKSTPPTPFRIEQGQNLVWPDAE